VHVAPVRSRALINGHQYGGEGPVGVRKPEVPPVVMRRQFIT
jgi:hypothetical protein